MFAELERMSNVSDDLKTLVERARHIKMTPEAERDQRQSFVYGNTHIENSRITRELVAEVDRKVDAADGHRVRKDK